ncbi:DUF1116 domain-containing protein [Paraburkholderia humisilvae]|uniref:Uncharacterized protein n=1 Tax=Paraburkholderia humisilvae TaxID=627669 RepID=A0A6J5EDW1_9BURK|nr:DUF1116 domain-containing protein [Paraburkholderia humisilvae]CAB3764738.1 hypothetical protein LMG29542_04941 [Paraburkholderia humisilvae]
MNPTNASTSNDARHPALARLYAVRPHWRAVVRARDAIGLPDFTLLHAGPPYADPCEPAAPVLSSAVLCCLYEKWATTETQAEHLIASGQVKLVNAQSFGVVTPLAAVVSPSSTLVEVADAHDPSRRAWSLAGSGAGPQIRFGSRDPAVLGRLAWRDTVLARELAAALEHVGPIDLFALAATGIAGGDDLHARTSAATAALRAQLSPFIEAPSVDAMLADTPLFFLTLWMAACHLMMSATARDADPATTLVVALAGNGREVGVRLAGKPHIWTTQPAAAPAGPRLDHAAHAVASPLTGDSGIIDAAGFGAHAFALAPEPAGTFAAWLPADWRRAQSALLAGDHPAFAGLRSALDAAAVVQQNVEPLAAIAMIGADGRTGLVGRGVYAAPVALFEAALRAL